MSGENEVKKNDIADAAKLEILVRIGKQSELHNHYLKHVLDDTKSNQSLLIAHNSFIESLNRECENISKNMGLGGTGGKDK